MKVTPEQHAAEIVDVRFYQLPETTVTLCQMKLRNGFVIIGKSACVDPAEFNKEMGEQIARRKADDKLWELLGFRLADQMHAAREG